MSDQGNQTLEVWKVTIDVQKHFNELGMRVRSIAVTVLGALLAGAGYALKEHSAVNFFGREVSLTGTILLAALISWTAFYVMDRLWYHRLLKAAVQHGRKVEDELVGSIPTVGLTTTIDEASPLVGLRAGTRLSIFYGFIAVLLWLGAGSALKADTPYYLIGMLLLLLVATLEASQHYGAAANRRRGFVRLGLVLGAIYFGCWGLRWWFASSTVPRYLKLSSEATKQNDWPTSTMWMRLANNANDTINTSLTWGFVWPVVVLIVTALVYWLSRGFRPFPDPSKA